MAVRREFSAGAADEEREPQHSEDSGGGEAELGRAAEAGDEEARGGDAEDAEETEGFHARMVSVAGGRLRGAAWALHLPRRRGPQGEELRAQIVEEWRAEKS